jgi:hypothetical protein
MNLAPECWGISAPAGRSSHAKTPNSNPRARVLITTTWWFWVRRSGTMRYRLRYALMPSSTRTNLEKWLFSAPRADRATKKRLRNWPRLGLGHSTHYPCAFSSKKACKSLWILSLKNIKNTKTRLKNFSKSAVKQFPRRRAPADRLLRYARNDDPQRFLSLVTASLHETPQRTWLASSTASTRLPQLSRP